MRLREIKHMINKQESGHALSYIFLVFISHMPLLPLARPKKM